MRTISLTLSTVSSSLTLVYPYYEKVTQVNPWYSKQRELELKSELDKRNNIGDINLD